MGYIPGVPIAEGNIHGYRPCRPMVVGHRTYGGWGGDYAVIQNEGLAHLLIGKDEGQWAQFGPTEALFYHCNGANDGYGIEMTGINEDDFTDWQIRCLQYVVPWLNVNLACPLRYSDGSDGWVNGHYYVGFHSHRSILTDDGTAQHTNLWKVSDWNKVVAAQPPAPKHKEAEGMIFHNVQVKDPNNTTPTGEWVQRVGYGMANVSAVDAYLAVMAGEPWQDNCSTMYIIAQCLKGAQAQRSQELWLTKVPALL